jgi:hypothetical protein
VSPSQTFLTIRDTDTVSLQKFGEKRAKNN